MHGGNGSRETNGREAEKRAVSGSRGVYGSSSARARRGGVVSGFGCERTEDALGDQERVHELGQEEEQEHELGQEEEQEHERGL